MEEKAPLLGSGSHQGSYPGSPYVQGGAPYPPQGAAPQAGYPQPGGPPPPAGAFPPKEGGQPPAGAAGGEEPSAPPADTMEQPPGYENLGFEGAALPPPSYDEATTGAPPERKEIQTGALITEEQAREAIINFAAENCCYGSKPAKEMSLRDFKSTNAFRYTLETFCETRSTKWTSQPYRGEGINVTGPPPGPWEVLAQPPALFSNSKMHIEVPNTANVKPCYSCNASGYRTCNFCMGSGRRRCMTCNGSGSSSFFEDGTTRYRPCSFCSGGYSSCMSCNGMGRTVCSKCQARGNLRWYIELTIKWTNHLEDHIVERTALPDELVRRVTGQIAFDETNTMVWPINHFPDQEINAASSNLVTKHRSQFHTAKILMQRHKVWVIPVTEVDYKYKDEKDSFFVYGLEHKVYCPSYPAKCCCGCSIL